MGRSHRKHSGRIPWSHSRDPGLHAQPVTMPDFSCWGGSVKFAIYAEILLDIKCNWSTYTVRCINIWTLTKLLFSLVWLNYCYLVSFSMLEFKLHNEYGLKVQTFSLGGVVFFTYKSGAQCRIQSTFNMWFPPV